MFFPDGPAPLEDAFEAHVYQAGASFEVSETVGQHDVSKHSVAHDNKLLGPHGGVQRGEISLYCTNARVTWLKGGMEKDGGLEAPRHRFCLDASGIGLGSRRVTDY